MAPAPGMTEQKLTKAQRAEQRKEKMRILREQEAKRKRRTIIAVTAGALLVLGLVAFVAIKLVLANTDTSRPEVKNVTAQYGIAVTPEGAATAEVNEDLPLVQVVEDPTCPHCIELHAIMVQAAAKHVKAGDIQFEWQPVSISPIGQQWREQGELAVASEFFVASYAPEKFEAYHDALMHEETGLYAVISEAASNGGEALGIDEIAAYAEQVGIDGEVIKDMKSQIGTKPWKNYLADVLESFTEAGNTGTPAVYLNGKEVDYGDDIAAWLDKVAAGDVK